MTLKYLFNHFTNIFILIFHHDFNVLKNRLAYTQSTCVERHSFEANSLYRSTRGFHVKKILPVVRSADTLRLIINFKLKEKKKFRNIASDVEILVQLFYNYFHNHIRWIVHFLRTDRSILHTVAV